MRPHWSIQFKLYLILRMESQLEVWSALPLKTRDEVLNKNPGFKSICKISEILKGVLQNGGSLKEPLSPAKIASFSVYKTMFAENRQSFKFENLRQVFVT